MVRNVVAVIEDMSDYHMTDKDRHVIAQVKDVTTEFYRVARELRGLGPSGHDRVLTDKTVAPDLETGVAYLTLQAFRSGTLKGRDRDLATERKINTDRLGLVKIVSIHSQDERGLGKPHFTDLASVRSEA